MSIGYNAGGIGAAMGGLGSVADLQAQERATRERAARAKKAAEQGPVDVDSNGVEVFGGDREPAVFWYKDGTYVSASELDALRARKRARNVAEQAALQSLTPEIGTELTVPSGPFKGWTGRVVQVNPLMVDLPGFGPRKI
jgi:transcription antitermination factor NusG